jgi:hypothetical protein
MYDIIDREQDEEVQAARYGAMMQEQSDAAPNPD